MIAYKWLELEKDFESWSGGFPPESEYQITVYVDYASPFQSRDEDVRGYLVDWYERGDPDFEGRFRKAWLGES